MKHRIPPSVFLQGNVQDQDPVLIPGESEHLGRVLRIGDGDPCTGLDGLGGSIPLMVRGTGRRLVVESAGPPRRDPAPGEAGAPLPWIEVAVAWPRGNRAGAMLGRLVQLGAAAITPLTASQAGPQSAPESAERFERVAREACKQSRRTWMPQIHTASSPAGRAGGGFPGSAHLLDPDAAEDFFTSLDALRSRRAEEPGLGTAARPLVFVIGPEGGFDGEESSALRAAGAEPVRLGPHVLRIETAAEAAMALAAGFIW